MSERVIQTAPSRYECYRAQGTGARGGWERWRYHENEEGFCSDFKERKEMLKHVRMLMEQCRRAGWHSEDPRHKQGSQAD